MKAPVSFFVRSVSGNISIDAYASTTLGHDHGEEMGGQLGVKARF